MLRYLSKWCFILSLYIPTNFRRNFMQTTLHCEVIAHWSVTVVGPLCVWTQYQWRVLHATIMLLETPYLLLLSPSQLFKNFVSWFSVGHIPSLLFDLSHTISLNMHQVYLSFFGQIKQSTADCRSLSIILTLVFQIMSHNVTLWHGCQIETQWDSSHVKAINKHCVTMD